MRVVSNTDYETTSNDGGEDIGDEVHEPIYPDLVDDSSEQSQPLLVNGSPAPLQVRNAAFGRALESASRSSHSSEDYEMVPRPGSGTSGVPSVFICPRCEGVLRSPVECSNCATVFCKTCVMNAANSNMCHNCDSEQVLWSPNAGLDRLLKSSLFPCPHVEGCDAILGTEADLNIHLATACPMVRVPCTDCGMPVQRSLLDDHHQQSCPMRGVVCERCGTSLAAVNMGDHTSECTPKKCPHGCEWEGAPLELGQHLTECSGAFVTCSFDRHGCAWTGRRDELEAHLAAAVALHLGFLTTYVDSVADSASASTRGSPASGSSTSRPGGNWFETRGRGFTCLGSDHGPCHRKAKKVFELIKTVCWVSLAFLFGENAVVAAYSACLEKFWSIDDSGVLNQFDDKWAAVKAWGFALGSVLWHGLKAGFGVFRENRWLWWCGLFTRIGEFWSTILPSADLSRDVLGGIVCVVLFGKLIGLHFLQVLMWCGLLAYSARQSRMALFERNNRQSFLSKRQRRWIVFGGWVFGFWSLVSAPLCYLVLYFL